MPFVHVSMHDGVAEVRLERGKVNALNPGVVAELADCYRQLAADPKVRGSLLTGTGSFFSFGFDIPEFLGYPKDAFTAYLEAFTGLYRQLFAHPKPVVAAVNGHAVAGGCMLATACDARVMAAGKGKIGLNEIGFGSSVFAGSAAMLAFWVGDRTAQDLLFSGALLTGEQALAVGLVDKVVPAVELDAAARGHLARLIDKDPVAFRSLKALTRSWVFEEMAARESRSIGDFVELWYSEPTWSRLKEIRIR